MAITALLMCSCIFEDMSDCPNYVEGAGDPIEVEFCVSSGDSTQTRSSVSVTENAVKYLTICIYHNGKLVKNEFFDSPSTFSISLVKGLKYNIYAIANYGRISGVTTEEEMIKFKFISEHITKIETGFPMCWKRLDYLAGKDSEKVTISLERLVSKINLSVDSSELEDFTINSVRLYQCAWSVYPFHENGDGGSRAESANEIGDGDYASASDLDKLNSGQSITFYAMENCQGVLLEGNKSADVKVPDKIPSSADLCTYLEITASHSGDYKGVALSSDHVTYRFFIGNDNCTDFNIRRNTDVNIHLTVTKDRIFDKGWKVDYGEDLPTVTYSLEASNSQISINAGNEAKVTLKHILLADNSRYNETDVTEYAEWTSSNTKVATVDKGVITAISGGSTTITATYNGIKTQIYVNVSNVVTYGLRIEIENTDIEVGSSESTTGYYVTYTNGIESDSRNINYSASWSTTSSSIATVSYGKITGKNPGTATITMKYNNMTESVTVRIVEKPTYELSITPEVLSVIDDKQSQLTAVYKTLRGTEIINVEDVTSKASWSTPSASIAHVSIGGKVTAVSEGSTTVTAKYEGLTATCTVVVTPRQVYELAFSETSLKLNKGESKAVDIMYNYYIDGELRSSSKIGSLANLTSSNTSVATISSTGIIRGVAAGTATITATYQGLTATMTVTVVGASSLSLEWTSATLAKGDQKSNVALYTITSNGSTTDVTNTASWKSSNTSVATVSRGVITARGAGTATITATYSSISVTCTVTVGSTADPTYVLLSQVRSVQVSGDTYELQIDITMSDKSVIKNVPYTWELTYSQNFSATVGKSGTGPLQYTLGDYLYVSIFDLETTGSYYNSSGNLVPIKRSYSLSHGMGWLP